MGSSEDDAEATPRWTFVGRETEVARVRRGVTERCGVVVVGAEGAGKSALVRAALGATEHHAVAAARGVEEVSFGAWAHLAPAGLELGEATAWRTLADHLRGDDGTITVLVDDAQWLDDASAALLHHLVSAHSARALVTARSQQPLPEAITALWTDGLLERVDLGPVAALEVGAVVEAALGAPVEPTTVARLHERSGGNLRHVRELVDEACRVGTLRHLHGAWVETGPTPLNARLAELLGHRLDDLGTDERAAAEVLAVASPIGAGRLRSLVPIAALHRLERAGLATIEAAPEPVDPADRRAGRTVALADPLLREVLGDRLPVGRRDEILDGLLAAFAEEGPPAQLAETDRIRVAGWRLDAGRPIDPDEACAAAALAHGRARFAEAARLAAAAVAAGGGLAARIQLGEALVALQCHTEAETVLEPVADALTDPGRTAELGDDLRFRYAQARALALSTEQGRLDDAIAVLEATIPTMADDRSRWALEARLSFLLADCGRLTAAAPLAEARLAAVADDEPSALTALVAGCLIRTKGGRPEDSLALCEALFPVALRHVDDRPEAIGWIAAAQLLATYVRGDLVATTELCEAIEELIGDDADPTIEAGLLMSRGLALSDRGRLDSALRLLQQAAALHEVDNRRGYQAWCFAITARVHAMRGDLAAARAALASAQAQLWPGGQGFAGDLHVAATWVAALGGDRAEATRILEEALAWAEPEGMVVVALRLRYEAIRAGLPVAPHVRAFATTTAGEQSPMAAAMAAHVAALAADDGRALTAAADLLADLGADLLAAEAFAQAAGAHRRAGSTALAVQAKEAGERARARCERAATPALRFGELVVGLTDREQDVTLRAAAGQTNQEIADALGISVRTAETHLQRAFAKIGIHRRRDLAPALGVGVGVGHPAS